MAKTRRGKFDLFTLAVKQQLIGTDIVMENGDVLEVQDFYTDYATSEVHLEFTDGSSSSFNLNEKFVVEIDELYKSIQPKKKNKRKKKKK